MKWLSKIFGIKHEEQPKEKISMSLDELSALIDSSISQNTESFKPDLEKFCSRIHYVADSMENKIEGLANAVPPEKVDFALLKVAVSHRDETVRKLNSMLKEFRKDVSYDLEAFTDFHNSCVSAINGVDSKLGRSFSVFEDIFRPESLSLLSQYKDAYKLLEEIGNDLKEKKSLMVPLNEVKNSIYAAKNILDEISGNIRMSKNLDSELRNLKAKEELLKKELEKLVSGEDWRAFESILKEKETCTQDMENVKMEISQTVSSIERVLKKYKSLPDAYGKDTIESYLESPFDATISDANQTEFNKVIDFAAAAIAERKLDMDDKKSGKLLKRIGEIKKDGVLERLVKKHERLQKRMQELDGQLEMTDIEKSKNSLDLELAGINRSMPKIEDQISRVKNANENAYRELAGIKISLENSAKAALNKEITVDVGSMRV